MKPRKLRSAPALLSAAMLTACAVGPDYHRPHTDVAPAFVGAEATAFSSQEAQSAFWSLIGLSAFVTPWVWRRVLALDRGGLATTIILGTNALGAALPIFGHSPLLLAISALVFGVAFFAVVGSTTAFVRLNSPPPEWHAGIAAMTIAFGIGQTLGPIAIGAITDAVGSLSSALNVSAAMLVLGALLSAFQRKLKQGT